jgi:hypothetical protein
MDKKRIIILQHNGGQLANQLWNFMGIYAYCRERGYECRNYSFFEYGYYFKNIKPGNVFMDIFFFRTFPVADSIFPFKVARKIARLFYGFYVKLIKIFSGDAIIYYGDDNQSPYYLSPTKASEGKLEALEKDNKRKAIYFHGWLFRNPIGLEKYRGQITKYFEPKEKYLRDAREQIKKIRSEYDTIIGVHMRKGDYKNWQDGKFFVGEKRFREIIDEYLLKFSIDSKKTAFIFFSDESVDISAFGGLHTFLPKNPHAIGDLYELSTCDAILGTDSTFGAFASYYGNIPFIMASNSEMQWDYYQDKKTYFENRFSKVVHY